jgi:hypothetical protein
MAIYAYADETIFTVDPSGDRRALGYGILISCTEISQNILNEALGNLRADPEFDHKKDQKTLDCGFFHASVDSKNAHSFLCDAINRHIRGVFDFTFEDNISEEDLNRRKYKEMVLARCLGSSSIEFFNSIEEVYLTIEQRGGFNETSARTWLDAIYKSFEESTYGIPSFKTFFPKIHIRLSGKSDPGLQVVDFLLWTANRSKRQPPENTWMKRLKITSGHWYTDKKKHNRAHYRLNSVLIQKPEAKYPYKFQKTEDWEQLQNAYIIIERILVNLDIGDFPSHAIHLYPNFEVISNRLKDISYHLKSEDLEWAGRVFLRLFDTVPLYKDIKPDEVEKWTTLFHAKYLASMLIRKDQIHFNRTQNAIHHWRYMMQTERPEEFKLLQFPDRNSE